MFITCHTYCSVKRYRLKNAGKEMFDLTARVSTENILVCIIVYYSYSFTCDLNFTVGQSHSQAEILRKTRKLVCVNLVCYNEMVVCLGRSLKEVLLYVCLTLQLASSAEPVAVGSKMMEMGLQPNQVAPVYVRYCPSAVETLTGKISMRPVGPGALKYSVSRVLLDAPKCYILTPNFPF